MSSESEDMAMTESVKDADAEESTKIENLARSIIEESINNILKRKELEETLYERIPEDEQLIAFIQSTLGAISDDIADGIREYIPRKEVYFWMSYFFLHFCGFQSFLDHLDERRANGTKIQDISAIIAQIIDEAVNTAESPEFTARSLINEMIRDSNLCQRQSEQSLKNSMREFLDKIVDVATNEPQVKKIVAVKFESNHEQDEQQLASIPKVCREYFGIFTVGEHFVDGIICEAIEKVTKHNRQTQSRKSSDLELIFENDSIPFDRIRMQFPSIESFSITSGRLALINILQLWKRRCFKEDWSFGVVFIMRRSDACSEFYTYEAKFALPTPLYPIAQATCSVLFRIEVSRVKPRMCPVSITYRIEASGYRYAIEDDVLQEKCLLNVINGKLRLFRRLRF